MKNSSVRIPIYGMFMQICIVLIACVLFPSCATKPEVISKPPEIKRHYNYPNILNDLDQIRLASNDGRSIEYLENLVDQEVIEGSKKFK